MNDAPNVSSWRNRVARVVASAAVIGGAVVGVRCGMQPDRQTVERSELRVQATLSTNPSQFLVGAECDGSNNMETASLVIPPDPTSPYCPNGRAFVSFGGWLQQVDLNWLSSPSGHATQRQYSSLMNFPGQVVNTGVCGLNCCSTSTAPKYVVAGNDTSMVRTGPRSLLILTAGYRRMTRFATTAVCGGTKKRCEPEIANAVNLALRSDDCGDTWTPSIAVDKGNGTGGPSQPGGLCSNLDFAHMYVDPFKAGPTGKNFIYLTGYAGFPCCGAGLDRHLLYRSDDGGATFVEKATLPKQTGIMGITSFTDGTTALFGCSDDNMGSPAHKGPRVLWSFGNGDTNFSSSGGGFFEGSTLSSCGTNHNASGQPAYVDGVVHFGPDMSSMSRMNDPSNSNAYNYFRFTYQSIISGRNGAILGYGVIPRNGGTAAAHMVQTGTIATVDPNADILRASFIDPTQFGTNVPNTSLLFWEEITPPSNNHNIRYSVVTGFRNYTPGRFFNLNGSSPNPWTRPNTTWIGEYDRGSYYFDSAASTATSNVLHYFAGWSQRHAACASPNAFVHYNKAQVTEPRYAGAQASAAMDLSTDPGATTLISNGADLQIHALAGGPGGAIKRIVYSDNAGTWAPSWSNLGSGTTDRAPAAASWGVGRLDAFVIGIGDKMLYHYAEQNQVQLLGGGGWESLGGPSGGFIDAPSATSQGSQKLFIVGPGTAGALYFKTYNNGWSGWSSLGGGSAIGPPSAASINAGRVDVWVRGLDDNLWQYTATDDGVAGWEGRGTWSNLALFVAGNMKGSPSVAIRSATALDVFAPDGYQAFITGPSDTGGQPQIAHIAFDSNWSDWHTIGAVVPAAHGIPHTRLAAVALSSSRLRVLHRGMDNKLWWMVNGP